MRFAMRTAMVHDGTDAIPPPRALLSARPRLPSPVHPPGISSAASVSRSVTSFIRLSAERAQQRAGRWDELAEHAERSRSWHDSATRSGASKHVARIRAMSPRFEAADRSEAGWVTSTTVTYPALRRGTDGGLLNPGLFRNSEEWPRRLRSYRDSSGSGENDGALSFAPQRDAVQSSELRVTGVHIDRNGAVSLDFVGEGEPASPHHSHSDGVRRSSTLTASLAVLAKKKKKLRNLRRAGRRAARDRPWRTETRY